MNVMQRQLLVAVCGVMAFAGGCLGPYEPGGPMMSDDQFTYVSTEWEPVTVILTDTRTGEELWTAEVPVGKKLTIRFYKNKSSGDKDFPDVMRWEIESADVPLRSTLKSQISVPSSNVRRLNVSYRSSPQFHD
ncbi:MAG: hypothetical protein KF757_05470 [Phycisphaeraceae bacterium]|nr:hypothetical protein [Phycisphaeraceae bacterium]MCW5763781.1 hypothetical protein [Phycisphaeraceae bacterium]